MSASNTTRKLSSGLLALKKIVEGTSKHTGEKFFQSLVQNLAETLDTHGVWVTEYLSDSNRLRSLAFWLNDQFVDEYEYAVEGTPCEPVLENESICHIPEKVIELYPNDPDLKPLNAVSYMGMSLRDNDGSILGHLALLDNRPMEELPEAFAIFRIFAARAEAELKRLKYEQLLVENEGKLQRLVNGTMDGLIEFDKDLKITQINQAVKKLFNGSKDTFTDRRINELLNANGYRKLTHSLKHLQNQSDHFCSTTIQDNIEFIKHSKEIFRAESTLSKYRYNNQDYYALFIRNVEDRINDQRELKKLALETTILREKVSQQGFDNIIGSSPAILNTLKMVHQVATTESTVLIKGETGTGKELIAQAIHNASLRKNKSMITLNCAALPSELVESELFGHVKGAYTGATSTREGRFLLADKGTIFLDEIGELPLSLQSKLLRVLQEGEFQPVGSSKTLKVDVRVITATNRELESEVESGKFREDLFYRLNVFPIQVPPLRDRGEDIITLSEAFMEKYAKRIGITPLALTEVHCHRLMSYHWPGNVRELQNIIERGVITSVGGLLNLDTLLLSDSKPGSSENIQNDRILTEPEMIELEKKNIIKALNVTDWKVSGKDGAAALLQIPPTTLSSRMTKLGIKR